MVRPVALSGENQTLSAINQHYIDTTAALRHYYSFPNSYPRFTGYTPEELVDELEKRLLEQNRTAALSVLAAVEAAFSIDFFQRVKKGKKNDPLAKAFRAVNRSTSAHLPMEVILDAWCDHAGVRRHIMGTLKGAFNYRHWLAHGRYWIPSLGRKYDYETIFEIADGIFTDLDMLR
jgi:hypothetical protein